jgi:U2-associated protein SR140
VRACLSHASVGVCSPNAALPRFLHTCSEQHAREQRRDRAGSGFDVLPEEAQQRGSYDTGDPLTTNLYVGNLAPTLDEHVLKLAFGKFGPIASVKIMWPRDEEQRARGRMSGFVAFMTRRSAEDALAEMQGRLLHDAELRLGWSKAVPLPPLPCWPPPAEGGVFPGLSAAPNHAHAAPGSASATTRPPPVEVRVPRAPGRVHIIDTLASYVALDGCAFEQAVVERERGNPVRCRFVHCACASTADGAHAVPGFRIYHRLCVR